MPFFNVHPLSNIYPLLFLCFKIPYHLFLIPWIKHSGNKASFKKKINFTFKLFYESCPFSSSFLLLFPSSSYWNDDVKGWLKRMNLDRLLGFKISPKLSRKTKFSKTLINFLYMYLSISLSEWLLTGMWSKSVWTKSGCLLRTNLPSLKDLNTRSSSE